MAECGPMRLVISAYVGKVPQPEMGTLAAEEAFRYLERLARLRHILGRRVKEIPEGIDDPLAVEMFRSVLTIGEEDLTPMAAVAGTIADAAAGYLIKYGMTKVVVNNGGDIAVRLRGEQDVKVGVRAEMDKSEGSHVISLDPGEPSWGIATSGLGGRSFTRGIASAVTVISRKSSLSDAAATAIANASFVEDEEVIQRNAEEIDPDTDIPGIPITVKVGPLSEEKRTEAISGAMKRVDDLIRKGIIFGALISVGGRIAMTDFFRERLVG